MSARSMLGDPPRPTPERTDHLTGMISPFWISRPVMEPGNTQLPVL
ncbi:MAG: hypothetical protein H6R36_450, partial [Chloroflexi bacterium]|nr:hypothetical protein [Chloroflexota bacterium]